MNKTILMLGTVFGLSVMAHAQNATAPAQSLSAAASEKATKYTGAASEKATKHAAAAEKTAKKRTDKIKTHVAKKSGAAQTLAPSAQ